MARKPPERTDNYRDGRDNYSERGRPERTERRSRFDDGRGSYDSRGGTYDDRADRYVEPVRREPYVEPVEPAVPAVDAQKRMDFIYNQLLNAFSFYLNEQTTPRALWNTHHVVQTQAKARQIQRPQMPQSATFCMVGTIWIYFMFEHLCVGDDICTH